MASSGNVRLDTLPDNVLQRLFHFHLDATVSLTVLLPAAVTPQSPILQYGPFLGFQGHELHLQMPPRRVHSAHAMGCSFLLW